MSLLNYVPYVLSCPMCVVPYVPRALRALVLHVFFCPTCLVPYVPSCFTCLVPYVSFAYVPRAKPALLIIVIDSNKDTFNINNINTLYPLRMATYVKMSLKIDRQDLKVTGEGLVMFKLEV